MNAHLFNRLRDANPFKRVVHRRTYLKEAAFALGIMLVFAVGYGGTMSAASRSAGRIVVQCSDQMTLQFDAADISEDSAALAHAACECLTNRFFERNGVVRLALFYTRWLGKDDFIPVDEIDESQCIDSVLEAYPLAAKDQADAS